MDLSLIVHGFSRRKFSLKSFGEVTEQGRGTTLKAQSLNASASHNLMVEHENKSSKMYLERQSSSVERFPYSNTSSLQSFVLDGSMALCRLHNSHKNYSENRIRCEDHGVKKGTSSFASLAYNEKLSLKEQLLISRVGFNGLYHCEICQKKFRYKTDLSRHLCIHLDIRPYACPIRSRRFIQKKSLNVHVKTHTRR